jgi:hypothetical protein
MDGGSILRDHEVDTDMIDAAGNGHGIADHVLKTHWSLEVKIWADTAMDRLTNMCPFRCVESTATETGDSWRYEFNQLWDAIEAVDPKLCRLLAVVI